MMFIFRPKEGFTAANSSQKWKNPDTRKISWRRETATEAVPTWGDDTGQTTQTSTGNLRIQCNTYLAVVDHSIILMFFIDKKISTGSCSDFGPEYETRFSRWLLEWNFYFYFSAAYHCCTWYLPLARALIPVRPTKVYHRLLQRNVRLRLTTIISLYWSWPRPFLATSSLQLYWRKH